MTTTLELQHFAVLEVSYLHFETFIVITCTTNNPCHLTLYYTDKEPVRHATSLVKRGVALPWGAYFCFVAWNSVEQQEAGDTLTHTFQVPDWSYCQTKWFTFRGTVEGPPLTYDFPALEGIAKVWEPWGETLTENYPWLPYTIPDIPQWTLENGILTLTNPGYIDCGIAYSPPYNTLPLLDPDNQPLTIMVDNPDASTNSSSTQIHHELIFRSSDEILSIYLAIALGAEWDYYKPQHHTVISGRDCGIFWIGPGYHNIDLYQLFVKFRTEFGKSTDPTGWWLNDIVYVMSLGEEHRTDYLKSDYIALYYPPLPEPTHVLSPSVTALIKHHHSGAEPMLFEHYNTGDNSYISVMGIYWRGQTFTPSISHKITNVKMLVYRYGSPGTSTVSIRATSGGLPTGADLCSGTFDADTLTTNPDGEWVEIDLGEGTALSASTKYAIVTRCPDGDVRFNMMRWRCKSPDGGYAEGAAVLGVYDSWYLEPNNADFMFEEWGIPM